MRLRAFIEANNLNYLVTPFSLLCISDTGIKSCVEGCLLFSIFKIILSKFPKWKVRTASLAATKLIRVVDYSLTILLYCLIVGEQSYPTEMSTIPQDNKFGESLVVKG